MATPVGPINEIGSPGRKVAQRRELAPCSITISEIIPFLRSTRRIAKASVCKRVPPTIGARVSKFFVAWHEILNIRPYLLSRVSGHYPKERILLCVDKFAEATALTTLP